MPKFEEDYDILTDFLAQEQLPISDNDDEDEEEYIDSAESDTIPAWTVDVTYTNGTEQALHGSSNTFFSERVESLYLKLAKYFADDDYNGCDDEEYIHIACARI